MNDDARLERVQTGAVTNMPGGQVHSIAPEDVKRDVKRLHVELYRNTARLRGGRIVELLELADVSVRQYDRLRGCWTIPVNRIDEVLCIAEYRQKRFVTVEDVAA